MHCCLNEDGVHEAQCVLARRRRRATSLCRWKHFAAVVVSIGLPVGGPTLCVLCVNVHTSGALMIQASYS